MSPDAGRRPTRMTTTGYSCANGVDTYYEVHGTGSPLVLLHGGILTIDLNWADLLPLLARSHQVIAIELQGHGHTADTDRDMTIAALADDVAAVLDHLDVPRADVLGFSLGAMVATQLAVAHPDRVERAVVASAAFRPEGGVDLTERPELLPSQDDFARMAQAYAAVAPDPDHFEEFFARTGRMVESFPGWTDEEIASITARTLVLVGDTDFVSVEHAVTMVGLLRDGALAVLPDTTHMDVTADVDVLAPIVERFLARQT